MMLINVETEQVLDLLGRNPEVIMDALASFAETDERVRGRLTDAIADADCGSTYHSRVLPWLRRLVAALEQNDDGT